MASCARRFGRNPYEHGREVRLEDRFQHQLEGCLHHPVGHGRDPQLAQFPARLGNLDLTYLDRLERPRP